MTDEEVNITFRGLPEYREKLQFEALRRKIKVQVMLEKAVELYLSTHPPIDAKPGSAATGGTHSVPVPNANPKGENTDSPKIQSSAEKLFGLAEEIRGVAHGLQVLTGRTRGELSGKGDGNKKDITGEQARKKRKAIEKRIGPHIKPGTKDHPKPGESETGAA